MRGTDRAAVEVAAAAEEPPTGASPGPSSSRTVYRAVTVSSVLAAGAVCGWAVLAPASLAAAAPWIAAVGIVLGVPHGAVDHLVPGWAAVDWRSRPRRVAVLAAYVAVAGVAAAALHYAPEVSFAVFLLVAALHFGWGESTFAAERRGDPVPGLGRGWWPTVAHGAVVIVLPLWSPDARVVLTPLAPGLIEVIARVPAVGVVATVVAVSAGTVGWRVWRGQAGEAAELAVLTVLFGLAPPLAAFGVYFGLWHAVRHTVRLLDTVAPGRGVGAALGAYARAAALPTVAVIAALVVLWAQRSDGVVILAGISVLLALTFPHVVIVAVLDRQRRHRPLRALPPNSRRHGPGSGRSRGVDPPGAAPDPTAVPGSSDACRRARRVP